MSEITNEDSGSKLPDELYGTYTWKILNFSETSKREYRSNAFEVGGLKWYILVYPQGCDVSNNLSLFLCVANHHNLLPGWSHFAQYTITLMNKDPNKSKHSDTLHEFWKKEHDWGWKNFMELPKLHDGFIDDYDSLIIKAQVQVIRENVDRPFPCLDGRYRRELVKVYLENVKKIFLRFMEQKRSKLMEDMTTWTSICAFWLGMNRNLRRKMSREKKDVILKLVVKDFFIKDEVTSSLVMHFLFYGLTSLDSNTSKEIRSVSKLLEDDLILEDEEPKKERATDDAKESLAPIVSVEKDMFVLVDDAMLLLEKEKAVLEHFPDERGPRNSTKASLIAVSDDVERDEKLLTELARRTLEVFVLHHIFCRKIEVAYKEHVALKMQEELIREEEEDMKKRRRTRSTK